MIAQVGDYVPMRGDGEHICHHALKHVRWRMRGGTRIEAERHSARTYADDDRCLTVRTVRSLAGRLGNYGEVIASLTAQHVWDLVELDRLEVELAGLFLARCVETKTCYCGEPLSFADQHNGTSWEKVTHCLSCYDGAPDAGPEARRYGRGTDEHEAVQNWADSVDPWPCEVSS